MTIAVVPIAPCEGFGVASPARMSLHGGLNSSMKTTLLRLVSSLVSCALAAVAAHAQAANPATNPVPRNDWMVQHEGFNARAKKGDVDVVFLGDSITQGWGGTNNTARDTAPQIAEGITAIVKEIQARTPATKILLLGVFPRTEKADTPTRLKIGQINEIIAKLDDGQKVFFLDIGPKFLQPDGTLTREIMPDLLHLSPAGYQIWADAIQAKLTELLK